MKDFVLGQEEYEPAPDYYDVKIEYAYYKKNCHGKWLIYIGNKWIMSKKPAQKIQNALNKKTVLRHHACKAKDRNKV